jgi:hypothetical protein
MTKFPTLSLHLRSSLQQCFADIETVTSPACILAQFAVFTAPQKFKILAPFLNCPIFFHKTPTSLLNNYGNFGTNLCPNIVGTVGLPQAKP